MLPSIHFTSLAEASPEELRIVASHSSAYAKKLPDRILQNLQLLALESDGEPVDRLTHSLQSATLAYEAGEDEEYVVCALLHDIGDTLGSYNHSEVAASILKPFVSEANCWTIEHHAIFQGYHFFHNMGLDRNLRDRFYDHPYFARTVKFCALYDMPAFDLRKQCMALEDFVPMVQRIFEKPKNPVVYPWG